MVDGGINHSQRQVELYIKSISAELGKRNGKLCQRISATERAKDPEYIDDPMSVNHHQLVFAHMLSSP